MTGGGLGGGVAAGAGALGMARFAAFGGRVLERAGFAGDLGADGRTAGDGGVVRQIVGCADVNGDWAGSLGDMGADGWTADDGGAVRGIVGYVDAAGDGAEVVIDLGADGRTAVGGEEVRRMAGCGGLVGEPGVGWLDFALESGGLQG